MVFWKNGKFHAIMWMWPFLCFKKKQKQRKMFHVEHSGRKRAYAERLCMYRNLTWQT